MTPITPTKITLHRTQAKLELHFVGVEYILSAEYLRVLSPSAEVKGHGPNQKNVPLNKEQVAITAIEKQGKYAIRILFDDGHDSGIYTWHYLQDLCINQDKHWKAYYLEAEQKRQSLEGVTSIKWINPN